MQVLLLRSVFLKGKIALLYFGNWSSSFLRDGTALPLHSHVPNPLLLFWLRPIDREIVLPWVLN